MKPNKINQTFRNSSQPTVVKDDKKIAVFGVTRGIGSEVAKLALSQGYKVKALVRDPSKVSFDIHDEIEVVIGDAENYQDVRATIRGCDAVICALGAPAMSKSKVRSRATQLIAEAMKEEELTRLFCVSLYGANESREALPFFLKYFFFPLYLRRAVVDHELQEKLVEASELDWTIVRPPHLNDGPRSGEYEHGFAPGTENLSLQISRADVADFILKELEQNQYLHQKPAISYRLAS